METIKEKIAVKTTVNAPIEKVWKYWTGESHITQWNNASPDWHTPKATNDLRNGGRFSFTMAAKDGSMSFDFGGTYTEVTENKSLAYSIDDDRKVRVEFTDNGGSVEIEEIFEAENQNPIDMQRGGWQAILDNFKSYTENN